MKRIRCLIPAVIETQEQARMTRDAYNSVFSMKHMVDVSVDTRKHELHSSRQWDLASKWNDWFDWWRGSGDYDYLLYVSNDNLLDCNCVDHLVKFFDKADSSVGVIAPNTEWDLDKFEDNFGKIKYSESLMNEMHCSTFMMRPGVIEKVGRMKSTYPLEFLDRDWFHRVRKAGFKTLGLDMRLAYHPKESVTTGNKQDRLYSARDRYIKEWGGDALNEKYVFPYNDASNHPFEYWDYPDYKYKWLNK